MKKFGQNILCDQQIAFFQRFLFSIFSLYVTGKCLCSQRFNFIVEKFLSIWLLLFDTRMQLMACIYRSVLISTVFQFQASNSITDVLTLTVDDRFNIIQ